MTYTRFRRAVNKNIIELELGHRASGISVIRGAELNSVLRFQNADAILSLGSGDQATFSVPVELGLAGAHDNTGTGTFTNTGYLDLDVLTGGSAAFDPVALTSVTGTQALIIISAATIVNNGTSTVHLAYRISGATTRAADDTKALRTSGVANLLIGASRIILLDDLTAGSNTFELQAKTSGGTATLTSPALYVLPMV